MRRWIVTTFPAPKLRDGGSPDEPNGVHWPKKGRRVELELHALVDLLTSPTVATGKFTAPLVVAGALEGDTRGERMQSVSCVVVDVEKGCTLDEADHALRDVAHVIYTSWRHTPADQRFRVVVPLASDVPAADYGALWSWAAAKLPGADPQAKDPTRSSFLPARRKTGEDYYRFIDGTDDVPCLDPKPILAAHREASKPAAAAPPRDALAGVPEGGRDIALFRYLCSLRAQGRPRDEAEVLGLQAAARCSPPFPPEQVKAKIARVWRLYVGKGEEDVDAALAPLREVVAAAQAAGTRAARNEAVAPLLADEGAILGLALVYEQRPALVEALLLRLEGLAHLATATKTLRAAIKEVAQQRPEPSATPDDCHQLVEHAIPTALEGHALPPGLRVPYGYRLSVFDGVQDLEDNRVARSVLLLTGRLVDLSSGVISLRVEWWWPGEGWHARVVPRHQLMDARSLVDLSRWGAPVSSDTAKRLVRYIEAFEALNRGTMPETSTSTTMGWQRDGALGFLWGRTLITPDGELVGDVGEVSPSEWGRARVHLLTDDATAGLADPYRAAGTWEGWLDAVELASPYPSVFLALYAALVPPLLAIVGAPNFVLDWAGDTSQGKTSSLRLAASAWGLPCDRQGIIYTWDARRPWIECTAAMCADLPFFLDDTKRAQDRPQDIAQTVYDVAQGRGRGRGTPTSIQRSRSYRTVLLSTGESPASSFTEDGGARARTLTLWGTPTGEVSEATGAAMRGMKEGLLENFGHVGPRLVRWLLTHREEWDNLREGYRAQVKTWAASAGGLNVAQRAAEYIAALQLAAELLHRRLGVPRPERDPLGVAWGAALKAAGDADRATAALHDVAGWAVANQHRFYGRQGAIRPPSWLGRWDDAAMWAEVAILAPELRHYLRGQGYEPNAILRTWADRGWIYPGDDGHRTLQRQIDGGKGRCVVLQRSAFEGVT